MLLHFFISGITTLVTIPYIIKKVKALQLLDMPDHRKEHTMPVPTMGGIGIFAGLMSGVLPFISFTPQIAAILISASVLFVMGIADDRYDIRATYKFGIQLSVAALLAIAGIRFTHLHGILGINEISEYVQYPLSIVAIAGIINAYNLIDGIDGLSGGLGLLGSLVFFGIFYTTGNHPMAIIAIASAGAYLAFLKYNFSPAQIFMGDTGSLVMGCLMAVLMIKGFSPELPSIPVAPHLLSAAVVFIPVADTLRVFIQRMAKGGSPFKPDRIHIHHLLTENSIKHAHASLLIYLLAITVLVVAGFTTIKAEWLLLQLVMIYLLALQLFRFMTWVKASRKMLSNHHKLQVFKSSNPFYHHSNG